MTRTQRRVGLDRSCKTPRNKQRRLANARARTQLARRGWPRFAIVVLGLQLPAVRAERIFGQLGKRVVSVRRESDTPNRCPSPRLNLAGHLCAESITGRTHASHHTSITYNASNELPHVGKLAPGVDAEQPRLLVCLSPARHRLESPPPSRSPQPTDRTCSGPGPLLSCRSVAARRRRQTRARGAEISPGLSCSVTHKALERSDDTRSRRARRPA